MLPQWEKIAPPRDARYAEELDVQEPRFHPGLHRTAWLVAIFTFPLIFVGGLVTTKGVGMSVPDWPNSYGYNMWFFPPSQWIGGIFWEHLHRLKGTLVGFAAIVLVMQAWGPARHPFVRKLLAGIAGAMLGLALMMSVSLFTLSGTPARIMEHTISIFASMGLIAGAAWISPVREERRWVRWLSVWLLIAVIVQGTLGGLRVSEVSLTLAIIHGVFAQAFFGLCIVMIVVTSRWWLRNSTVHLPHGRALKTMLLVSVIALFVQLIVGAIMRHHQAGLAIPDLPLHYGRLLPPTTATELAEVNAYRSRPDVFLPIVSLEQIWLHFAHRVGAVIVSVLLIVSAILAFRCDRRAGLGMLTIGMLVLLVVQFTLGLLTVYYRKPADIASSHVAVGALLLVVTIALLTRVARVHRSPRSAGAVHAGDPLDAARGAGVKWEPAR
ncbi:MAG TPA: COX15/CtaA family protein [Tepidisphaeraceae bacterium]|nr:COX15/CtaA family protein [Tepidisphaeraceae bacterium]